MSPPVEPPDEPVPAPEAPELAGSEGLLPDMSPLPVVPSVDAPPLVLPGSDARLPDVPMSDAPLLLPEVPVSEAPPDVPPGGGVLGAAPGDSEGGGVVVAGADVSGAGVTGALLVPPVPVPWSPPPRLQAATLIVSKPIKIRIFEACSLGFIAIPFN